MSKSFSKTIIHDKHRREYLVVASELDSEIFKRFNILHRGRRIGYVNYHFEGDDILFIDDFHIEDKAMRPPWFSVDLIFWGCSFPPEGWRITNFQRGGVGTATIEFLKDFAKSESLKRIEGVVKPHDFNENPDLLNWYRRRGFVIEKRDEKVAGVAKISLTV